MGGFLGLYDHTIARKTHPKRDVIVVGDASVLEDEGLRIGPVSSQPLRGSVLSFGHAVDAIQTDWQALGLGTVGKGQVPRGCVRIVELEAHRLHPDRIWSKDKGLA